MSTSTATVLALLLAAPVQAQAPDATHPVRGSVETIAGEVEVLVLDGKDKPVAGLARGDFRLFVNGRETPIDYLEEPPGRTTAAEGAPLAPLAVPPASDAALIPRRPHSTVLIFDDLHTSFGARRKGITGLRTYVAALPEGEEVAVYGLNLGLKTLQPFTRDRALVGRALDGAGSTMPVSQVDFPTIDGYIARSRQALRAFGDLFRALGSRPEPKTVVLVAGILPAEGEANAGLRRPANAARFSSFGASASPGIRGGSAVAHVPSSTYAYSFVDEAKGMANEALLARATVIALDPTGLEAPGSGADVPGTEAPAPNVARVDSFAYLNDTFALLAGDTGGARVGFSNAYGDRLLAESDRLNSRYRIGFTPPDSTSDRRAIRVEVSRPNVTVRVASGQRSLTPVAAARARFSALLLRSDPARGDFPITVKVEGPVANRKSDALNFDILIPLSGVFAEAASDVRRAHLELLVAGVDPEGRVGDLMVLPFEVEIAKDAPADGFFRHHGNFQLDRTWNGRLFLGVRDQATNQLGAAAIPIGS